MGFTMDMLVMCHNFRTILHFIFGQAYAYFVGTLPQYMKAKSGLQVQVPPQFYEQLHLTDPTTIRFNLIPYFYEMTVSDSMVEYPVIGGVFLINKSKQNQFLKEFCAELLYEGLPTVGDSFTMGTKFYNYHKRLEKMFCSYTMVLHAFAFTVTMLG